MPLNVEDRDTFIRNLRLSASWRVIFAFVIHPALSALYLGYSIYYQTDDGFLSRRLQIVLPLYYFIIISGVFLPLATMEHEEKRLQTLGYEQRRSRPAQIHWLFSVGVFFALTFWLYFQGFEELRVPLQISTLVIKVLSFWTGLTVLLLGPIWWFSKRVR